MEKLTFCGDDCMHCPRYLAKSDAELEKTAELWYRVGWRDTVVSAEEMRCGGCSEHKSCTYGLVACIKQHGVLQCSRCTEFPCEKIEQMLERSEMYRKRCREVCSPEEFALLERAFFNKAENLKKPLVAAKTTEYTVVRIYEEDYGCEGVPDGQEPMCSVMLRDTSGAEKWVKLPDSYLTENRIKTGSLLKLTDK